ncbi:MAG: alpha-hydroxy-acid oxidizing protein [Acidobacteriota bacterium]
MPIPPRSDLVNVLEYEDAAKATLPSNVLARIAGGDRAPFDRMTLRHRIMAPTTDLDLTVALFGDTIAAPIIVGPIADQRRFHTEAELATARGVASAKTIMVVSAEPSASLDDIIKTSAAPIWAQVFATALNAKDAVAHATAARCRAVCLTVRAGASASARAPVPPSVPIPWSVVGDLIHATSVPVIVKGIMSVEDAREAVEHGAKGLIVSSYQGGPSTTGVPPILSLGAIVEAVDDRVPVMVDGSFRRGTDVVKALALGARAVLVGRPVMWGLAAYGADGVQGVVEMLQTELARYMCMCGKATLAELAPDVVRLHAVRAPRPATRTTTRG